MSLSAFTFGTSLWAGVSPLLFEATAAVEAARGYAPPLLIDVSSGSAIADCASPAFTRVDPGRAIGIHRDGAHDSDAGRRLLALALERHANNQRVVLACACWVNRSECRRHELADQMLAAAEEARVPLEICEWPGGAPMRLDLELTPLDLTRIARGALSLRAPLSIADLAGLPWASLVRAHCADREACFLSGPAQPAQGELLLPVYSAVDENVDVEQLRREMTRDFRLAPRKTSF